MSDGLANTAAMMVIVLPSQYKGGDLFVCDQHDTCDGYCLEPDACTTSCVAFFADLDYGLEAVQGGSKLALFYRLVQRSVGPLPSFQDTGCFQYLIGQFVEDWEDRKLLPKRAIHMLDNKYDYHELQGGIEDLIGRDQAVATALTRVHRSGLQVYLAIVTKEESDTSTDTVVSWTADRWQCLSTGGSLGYFKGLGSVDINAAEILQGEDCFAEADFETVYSFDDPPEYGRRWQQAALVFWPRCHSHQLLCDSGQAPAVAVLNDMTHGAVWERRQLAKAAAQLTSVHADELAAAMAAAAEAAVPDQRGLREACTFAEAVWTRFSKALLNAKGGPHEQFVHLIHELGMDELALRIADKLKETAAEHAAQWNLMLRRLIVHPAPHGLAYPGPEVRLQHYQELDLTPSTAKELSLLAELVGWSPFLPIMLDMASRPNDRSHIHYSHTDGWGHHLRCTWGGFKALEILSKCARGPSSQQLVEVLPKMAVAVAQTGLQNTEGLFGKGNKAVDSEVQAGYRRFVLDIAYIVSDLTTIAAEDSKSELKAVHDSLVEVYMKQPADDLDCFAFFHAVIVPACESMASCRRKGKRMLAGCPVLQSLMQACIARLEELTKSVPQEPKEWAFDDELECYAETRPSAPAADEMSMNCCQLQAFLEDGARKVFTATLSRAEVDHLDE
ncbi:hypothetical protein ABBQ38_013515 [Trebouxia sp. C0009 RCD-2024]